ncbi:hypothetical protein M378DRAFT_10052 [Amanita muscaria Koide BX008]|uniref:Yeast cell wall synthesis Kre9/Knh1-like N-terminal domain-containing protein n=1 Tax=Amanita muscaria (strain Koide BX008) TaxID=946122 RepID=A0A0C2WY18_AMAMK|nr:hypothetical protein M378DRAFT_10052 [Amanita muscaria Koide BX008]
MLPTVILVLTSLVASVLGTVYITEPTGSSTFTAGQQATIKWQDDGVAPTLDKFGPSKVSIYVGNAIQQTPLQLISDNVDVSKISTIQFTPNPAIGPNGNNYFIRFESLNAKDPKQAQYPALAFSSKFSMNGMSGTFNASIQSQIDGQSTAPLAGPTGSATTATATSAQILPTSKLNSTGSATHTGTSSTATGTHNAAVANLEGGGVLGLVLAAIVGAAVF